MASLVMAFTDLNDFKLKLLLAFLKSLFQHLPYEVLHADHDFSSLSVASHFSLEVFFSSITCSSQLLDLGGLLSFKLGNEALHLIVPIK